MKISDISSYERPRERFLRNGVENLSDAELLAIIIGNGGNNISSLEIATNLIKEIGLEKLPTSSITELSKLKGIGKIRAMQLNCLFEISTRSNKRKNNIDIITSAKDVYNIMIDELKNKKKEYFYTLILNTRNEVIKKDLISIGTLNMSVVHPREIFKNAIKESANSIILVHNHPSNSGEPSKEDIETTKQIVKAGELLQIKVLDHVIIHDDGWNSII